MPDRSTYRMWTDGRLIEEAKYDPNRELAIVLGERFEDAVRDGEINLEDQRETIRDLKIDLRKLEFELEEAEHKIDELELMLSDREHTIKNLEERNA